MPDGPVATRAKSRRALSLASAVGLVVTAGLALAIGAGLGASTPTLAARAAAVESRIRCPSCQDISVAQSEAPSAIAARRRVVSMLVAGQSEASVEQSFVERYGPSILLSPPPSGLSSLIWVLPVVGLVVALTGLGALFWRRQRELVLLRAPPK